MLAHSLSLPQINKLIKFKEKKKETKTGMTGLGQGKKGHIVGNVKCNVYELGINLEGLRYKWKERSDVV